MPPKKRTNSSKKEEKEKSEDQVVEKKQKKITQLFEKGKGKGKADKEADKEADIEAKEENGKGKEEIETKKEVEGEGEFATSTVVLGNGSKMKLVSWNVNGLRAAVNKGFVASIKKINADVVCLGEVKCEKSEFKELKSLSDYPYVYWNASKEQKGYSGTA